MRRLASLVALAAVALAFVFVGPAPAAAQDLGAKVHAEVARSITGQTYASLTHEVLVTTGAAVSIPRTANSRSVEIQNRGPNSIFCAENNASDAVVNKSREIMPGNSWAIDAPGHVPIYCIAASANQVTGAATIETELM